MESPSVLIGLKVKGSKKVSALQGLVDKISDLIKNAALNLFPKSCHSHNRELTMSFFLYHALITTAKSGYQYKFCSIYVQFSCYLTHLLPMKTSENH